MTCKSRCSYRTVQVSRKVCKTIRIWLPRFENLQFFSVNNKFASEWEKRGWNWQTFQRYLVMWWKEVETGKKYISTELVWEEDVTERQQSSWTTHNQNNDLGNSHSLSVTIWSWGDLHTHSNQSDHGPNLWQHSLFPHYTPNYGFRSQLTFLYAPCRQKHRLQEILD